MIEPYTSCGDIQVNRDAGFAALLLVFDPYHPHPCCFKNTPSERLVKVAQHLYIYKITVA